MIGTSVKMLHTHRLQLAIHRFDALAIAAQVKLVSPSLRGHIAATNRHKANPTGSQNGGRIWVRDIAFVTKDWRPVGQYKRQFVKAQEGFQGVSKEGRQKDMPLIWLA